MSAWHRRSACAILVLAALASGRRAHGQAASDAAAAEALFNEAQKLVAAGDYQGACPKFAESLRLDAGIGVMLYLADCYERTGRTASAWAEFKEAEELATKQADRRAATAHQRAAAIEPTLARLVVRVEPGADVPGLELHRDTTLVGRPQWGSSVPVDPGPHTIVVSAPGKKTRQIPVRVVAGGSPTVLSILPLEDDHGGPEPPPVSTELPPGRETLAAPPPAPSSGSAQRTVAYLVGAAGLVGVVVGSAFGFDTISKNNASNSDGHCNATTNQCDDTGVRLRNQAKSSALASDIAFGVGAAALAGGVVLYLTAPASSSPAIGLGPAFDTRGGGLLLTGAW